MRSTHVIGLIAGMILGGTACGDAAVPTEPTPTPIDTVHVVGVKVNPKAIQFFALGDTQTIIATIAPANATDKRIIWETTDSTIASVDSTGRVTARAGGFNVFVTAYTKDGNFQASVSVNVNQ